MRLWIQILLNTGKAFSAIARWRIATRLKLLFDRICTEGANPADVEYGRMISDFVKSTESVDCLAIRFPTLVIVKVTFNGVVTIRALVLEGEVKRLLDKLPDLLLNPSELLSKLGSLNAEPLGNGSDGANPSSEPVDASLKSRPKRTPRKKN